LAKAALKVGLRPPEKAAMRKFRNNTNERQHEQRTGRGRKPYGFFELPKVLQNVRAWDVLRPPPFLAKMAFGPDNSGRSFLHWRKDWRV
jgi:hypothetical protein